MNARYRTYTAYSIGVGIVWAVLLVLASIFDPAGRRNNIFLVFAGFAIGTRTNALRRCRDQQTYAGASYPGISRL